MRQGNSLQPRQTVQSKLVLTLSAVGGGLLLMALIFGIGMADQKKSLKDGEGKTYYFVGMENNYYENPANWEPAYPGTRIEAKDKVVIQKDVHFIGYDIQVNGEVQVDMDATVFSGDGNIYISGGGKVSNDGRIIVNQVENFGTIDNNFSATINLRKYFSYEESSTTNSHSASFIILGDVVNEGKFDNYSLCTIGNNFENNAIFNQMRSSELIVKGQRVEVAVSN